MNRAATAEGLRPGMGLADARAVLPDLQVEQSAIKADEKALDSLARWCGRYTPWTVVDPHGANPFTGGRGGILMDVTGCAHLFGGEEALLADLMGRLKGFGIEARMALADTPGAAWALARYGKLGKARAAIVPPKEGRESLAALPVAALRLGYGTLETFDRLGLRRIEDLLKLPRAPLVRRFGPQVARRIDQALGREDEPISPILPVVPYRARLSFLEPVGRVDDIAYALETLLDQLCPLLDEDQRGARRLTLDLFRVDGEVKSVTVGTSRPVRTPKHLARLFAGRLDEIDAGFGIDAATLSAPLTEALTGTQVELSGETDRGSDLGLLIDQLGNRLGMDKVCRLEARESFVPERAVVTVPIAAGPAPESAPDDAPLWPAHLKRPLRMLSVPELVQVVAEVPDGPPVLFRWRQGNHRVAQTNGPERIAPEWWRAQGPGSQQARDYYRVEDSQGRRFWLFREGLYPTDSAHAGGGAKPRWYLQGIFA
jgi:protein ImuB